MDAELSKESAQAEVENDVPLYRVEESEKTPLEVPIHQILEYSS
jgi:hypothetical protein